MSYHTRACRMSCKRLGVAKTLLLDKGGSVGAALFCLVWIDVLTCAADSETADL